ncbi:MAG: helicase-related protein, partial [Myxococcota bacterium]
MSQWGHDFRPSYLTLRKALEELGRPPVLATTATAPPHVREDILHQLGAEDAKVVTTTFDRPNLHFEVIALSNEDDKIKTLITLVKKLPKPGVVYCATVKKVEELYEKLARHGVKVARYHGRLAKKERDAQQDAFMESKDLVMIATNAFGLGVDKKNIRYVLHYHVPGSLESYAQEAGRGGRDGKPARCVLLFSPDDVAIQEYFLTGTYPTRRQVRAVYKSLLAWADHTSTPPTVANLAVGSRVGAQRTRTILSLLKDEGFVIERDDTTFWLADPPPDPDLLNEKAKQYEARRIADRQRLDALLDYVRAPGCRNQVILAYLGEDEAPECGRCDNCLRSRDAAMAAADRASRLEESVTRTLNQDWGGDEPPPRPRRIIRHRVIRIDEPPTEESFEATAGDATPSSSGAATAVGEAGGASDAPARGEQAKAVGQRGQKGQRGSARRSAADSARTRAPQPAAAAVDNSPSDAPRDPQGPAADGPPVAEATVEAATAAPAKNGRPQMALPFPAGAEAAAAADSQPPQASAAATGNGAAEPSAA